MQNTPPPYKAGDTGRLDFISPRETARIKNARSERRTRIIAKLRLWLPLSAGIVILTLFLWPKIAPNFVMKNVVKNIPDLVIDNLHYTGVDNKNEPYSLNAAQATRPAGLATMYDLVRPEGEITLQSGSWLDGRANYGRYDEATKKLWLGGNVRLFHDKGYQVTSEEAQIDLDTDTAWGDKPVLIQGNFGTIRGTGFRFLDGGHIVVVTGPATATLSLHQGQGSDTSSGGPLPANPLPDSNK
ncbi:MAG: LPS export ABC transporter periplasmic protein LptC [Alphaproteobacteria bacterium]|nr:LPS export ABC transporter periplasmic protein LptC [Alphaproteobacteria bacterium]